MSSVMTWQMERIRSFAQERFARDAEVLPDIVTMPDHRHKPHKGHVTYMPVDMTTGGVHPIATETCKKRFGIMLLDLSDQLSSMQITRGLTGYDKIPSH